MSEDFSYDVFISHTSLQTRLPRLPGRTLVAAGVVLVLALLIATGRLLTRCDGPDNQIAFVSMRLPDDDLALVDAETGVRCRLMPRLSRFSLSTNQLAWSPDGTRLAYMSNSALMLLDLASAQPQQLLYGPVDYQQPLAWSPDGTQIAFVALDPNALFADPGFTISIIDARVDARPRVLTTVKHARGSLLAWSPSGRQLLFDADDGISVIHVDGTQRRMLVPEGRQPAWSPDGTRIAFVLHDAVAVMASDGTQRRTLAAPGHSPTWSPDGSRIAFGAPGALMVVDADGGAPRLLFAGDVSQADESNQPTLAWSPDSRRLAFISGLDIVRNREGGIFVINADGTQLRQLIRQGLNRSLAWRPPRQSTLQTP